MAQGQVFDVPVELVQHRWCIPILAETQRLGGARFASYRGHLEISRDALTSTLNYLMALDLIERNTGYGHPLRPEYVATARGRTIGPACSELHDCIRRLKVEDIALRKWSLPVISAVYADCCSFALLRKRLHPITPRALSKCLVGLGAAGLIKKDQGTPRYSLSQAGRTLISPLAELCLLFDAREQSN